ncbi:hypothetical protein D3C75_667500 [compost metagenome]
MLLSELLYYRAELTDCDAAADDTGRNEEVHECQSVAVPGSDIWPFEYYPDAGSGGAAPGGAEPDREDDYPLYLVCAGK